MLQLTLNVFMIKIYNSYRCSTSWMYTLIIACTGTIDTTNPTLSESIAKTMKHII